MNVEETGRVLAKCAGYDRRKEGDAQTIAWYQAIGDLPYEDCIAAVVAHYTETTDWIMPAHVRNRVKTIRDRRLQDTEVPADMLVPFVDDPPAYLNALRTAETAIADGRDPRAALLTLTRQARRELEAS